MTLSSLGDIKIVGGHQRHLDATIVANIFNSSAIDITVSSFVEMSYNQAWVCWFLACAAFLLLILFFGHSDWLCRADGEELQYILPSESLS